MIVTLIPFFLSVNVAILEPWKYGPEYVYELTVNSSVTRPNEDDPFKDTYIHSNLICRPKSNTTLSCSLELMKIRCEDGNEYIHKMYGNPFELKYNERGIDRLIVHKGHPLINARSLIKLIVDQWSLGAETLSRPALSNFRDVTVSAIGKCTTQFLTELTSKLNVQGERLLVIKDVQVEDCAKHVHVYFAGSIDFDRMLVIDSHMVKSKSRVSVDDLRFYTSTTRQGYVASVAKERTGTLVDMVTIELKDIRAAKKPLPVISTPSEWPL